MCTTQHVAGPVMPTLPACPHDLSLAAEPPLHALPAVQIWALGCVLYELCALKPLFMAKSHKEVKAKVGG